MKSQRNEGFALLGVLILGIGLAALAAMIATRSLTDVQQTTVHTQYTRAFEAAESGLDIANAQLWANYLATDPAGDGSSGTLTDYQNYLANLVVDGGTAELLVVPAAVGGQAQVTSILIARADNATGTTFTITSTGQSAGYTKQAVASARVGGQQFTGFEYAVLANNVNCIMCHADFDDVNRATNTDSNNYGTYDRLKIASLESLLIRVGSADSTMTGTYYTRGTISDKSGNPLTDLTGSTVTSFQFDASGKVIQDSSGNMTSVEMPLAGTDPMSGLYNPLEYLYTDYPTTQAEMTDGDLPTSFPAIFPDGNADKMVDPTEYVSLRDSYSLGSLNGGVAFGLPSSATYGDPSLPTSSNGAATDLYNTGEYSGNVFLIGTAANPIKIDGPIFVDGDLVIKGPIEGVGQIYTRGNIYFAGDTTYNDVAGTYGQASDGSENLVSFSAGGNILIGDYLTPKSTVASVWDPKKQHWVDKTINFDVTSPEYLTATDIDSGGPPNSGNVSSFTMSEVTLFNKMEYQKAQADPAYTPRYYRLRPGDPVYRFDNPAKEHGDKYDNTFVAFTPQANAAVVDLSPEGGWLSELFLKQAWRDDELSRDPGGQPFKIDGLLYTNNAVMALARSMEKHNSRAIGQLIIRGGLVGADLGILSGGDKAIGNRGFTMLYDKRVAGFLGIEDVSNLVFTKRLRMFI